MKTYQSFTLSNNLIKQIETKKADKYVRDYYKEHGSYPTTNEIISAATLTEAEYEEYKRLAYSNYLSDTSMKLDFVRPEPTQNTPQQDTNEQTIVDTIVGGDKNVVIEEGTINNVVIPSGVTVLANITGEVEDGATIVSESPKSFTLNNTSEEPVDVTIQANSSVYLTGQYNDVYVDGKSISAASGKYAKISGDVTFDPGINENVSVTAEFVGDDASVNYAGSNKLTISNSKGEQPASLEVFAPNATVEAGGQYDTFAASVSDDTLVLKPAFHARALNVKEGSVMYYGIDIKDFADKLVNPDVETRPYTVTVDSSNVSKLTSNPGVYNFSEDVTYNKVVAFGIFASGKYQYNLNNHIFTCGNASTGCMYVRGSANINFYGPGKLINNAQSYGVWIDGNNVVANIYGGDFEAYTHVLYAYHGTFNIYGGTFKLLGGGSLDPKGHEKFLLNCYDASFRDGTAKINVYGGKFYNFNPAESYGEPGGPVSFVAPGYHVVETEENGVPVFEVVKD